MTDMFRDDLPQLPVVDPEKDYSAELIGEGKKYVDQRAAARALVEKDRFIEQLKNETAQMRKHVAETQAMSALIAKMEELQKTTQPASNHDAPPARREEVPPSQPVIDENKLLELMNRRDQEKTREANEAAVNRKLQQVWGDNYKQRVTQEASKLGIGTEFLSNVARENPQAFYRLFGLDQDQPVRPDVPAPQSTFRPSGSAAAGKTYSYYEKLRQSDPRTYWAPATQNEMLKQLSELGQEDFYK